MRLALDVMGGDFAPGAAVEGAIAYSQSSGDELILVGDLAAIEPLLGREGAGLRVRRVRGSKPVNSLRECLALLKAREADAVVSAGDSVRIVASARLTLGRLRGVARPAIGTLIPVAPERQVVLLDSGANVICRAEHLIQFAFLGEVYARHMLSVERPRVGLLSNGAEPTKGTPELRAARRALEKTSLDFRGFVEPHAVFEDAVDVVVTDGLSGNLVLKTIEGTLTAMRRLLEASGLSGGLRLDWAEQGGAPLLGVDGVCIVAHGRSNGRAMKNALAVASRMAACELPRWLAEGGEAAERLLGSIDPDWTGRR